MARGVTTLLGILGAAAITVGTWLYVAGIAPPYPLNAALFNAALLASLILALAGGRR